MPGAWRSRPAVVERHEVDGRGGVTCGFSSTPALIMASLPQISSGAQPSSSAGT
ncbi:MAG: hypothetical protein ACLSVD_02625 [Eggerthellaceae bacterium]